MSGCENCVCIKREDAARMAVLETENNHLKRELSGLASSAASAATRTPTYKQKGHSRFMVRQNTGEGRRRSRRRSRGRLGRSRGRKKGRSRGRH